MCISGSVDLDELRMTTDPGEMNPTKVALILGLEFPDEIRNDLLAKFFKRGAAVEVFTPDDARVILPENNFRVTVYRPTKREPLLPDKPFHVLEDAAAEQFDFIYHMNYFLHPDGAESVSFCAWPKEENSDMHWRVL